MRHLWLVLLGVLACGSDHPTAPRQPNLHALVTIRAIVGGCALDWTLTSDTTLAIAYAVGSSDSQGSFDTTSPHFFTGTFQSLKQFSDDPTASSTSIDYVFARMSVLGHDGWGMIWGRPYRILRSDAVGADGKPDCTLL